MPTHYLCFSVFVAYEILRGANGAPIIDPFDSSTIIEGGADKTIECKASKPVTWVSEVGLINGFLVLGYQRIGGGVRLFQVSVLSKIRSFTIENYNLNFSKTFLFNGIFLNKNLSTVSSFSL